MSVLSPMIVMEFLFAPTVPSEPSPQNLQRIVPSGAAAMCSWTGRDVWVTSSTMLMVKRSLGWKSLRLSNTDLMWVGVVSFEPRP
ncbi:MAG: hypothetical protein BWY99_01901 [Synergistetes bacterium ADurb.BinA166]|nr:MAG: hypothetical protein BWY99_01901 [Synergistetes bacterium ADurb.BinA166]